MDMLRRLISRRIIIIIIIIAIDLQLMSKITGVSFLAHIVGLCWRKYDDDEAVSIPERDELSCYINIARAWYAIKTYLTWG